MREKERILDKRGVRSITLIIGRCLKNMTYDSLDDRYDVTDLVSGPFYDVLQLLEKSVGINIVTTTSPTIKQLVYKHHHNNNHSTEAGIYQIPCSECPLSYYGQTARSLKKRVYEHERAVALGYSQNALAIHEKKTAHKPNFKKAKLIKPCHSKKLRKLYESVIINQLPHLPSQRSGFIKICENLAFQIMHSARLHAENG